MAKLPNDLPSLLRDAGLKVVVVDGWQTRGRPGSFSPVGVLNHHTGSSAMGWSLARELEYAEWMFKSGRSDLPAPLCQIALGRSGTVYLGAAGRANHAGKAKASGSVGAGDGNKLYIGIEWMLSGTEEIPASMKSAGAILNAVLTQKVTKTSVETISSHYQTSETGKWDIGDPKGVQYRDKKVMDVPGFRKQVLAERNRLYLKPAAVSDEPGTIRVATNNVMSLPKNPKPRTTMNSAPTATVVMLQEIDVFHPQARTVPGYACVPIPKKTVKGKLVEDDTYNAGIIYNATVWTLLGYRYTKQYDGAKGISKTRRICIARFRHRKLGHEVVFISYHDVTKGEDSIRKGLRRKARAAVRKEIRYYKKRGVPVVLGADTNQKTSVYKSADIFQSNGLDHLYFWNGKKFTWTFRAKRTVKTTSDHRTVVVRTKATVKK